MRTYIEDLNFVWDDLKRRGIEIKIYSICVGEDEIIDREFLKKKYKVNGIAVKRIKSVTRFELMDI